MNQADQSDYSDAPEFAKVFSHCIIFYTVQEEMGVVGQDCQSVY